MSVEPKCDKCGSTCIKETITGGMTQTVHWEDGYVVRAETTYEKNDDHSEFLCKDCKNEF